jgi:hypothetical protein
MAMIAKYSGEYSGVYGKTCILMDAAVILRYLTSTRLFQDIALIVTKF